ncbi:glycosyltransferase [Pseudovibrio exalbescens]|uniref:Glycosyltransferase n=1 Tax=Pseudovibrio exalbescens TaxID=197461 RepID=A0A1U7JJP6_9HYPH|nr:glycosyltransferase [Pseudovibrio exalbescens]OKL44963.1 hypothetical protein A3843_05525 [Pseudovibrio exalbescens]
MKICMIVEALEGDEMARVALDLSGGLASRGHVVQLIGLTGAQLEQHLVPDGVEALCFQRGKVSVALADLVRLFENDRPDVVIAHGQRANTCAITAAKLRSRPPLPIVAVEHRMFSVDASLDEDARREIALLAVPYSYRDADVIICVMESIASVIGLCDWLDDEFLRVIYNPLVSFDVFEASERAIEEPWFEPKGRVVIVSSGPLSKGSGHEDLLQALAVSRYKLDLLGIVIGEGEVRDALEQMASSLALEDVVVLPGNVSGIERFLRAADVYVQPHAGDAFDRQVAVAMALGTPMAVVGGSAGAHEILEDVEAAVLCAEGSAEELSRALVSLSKCRKPVDALTEKARLFSAERVFDAYEGVLKKVSMPPETNGS